MIRMLGVLTIAVILGAAVPARAGDLTLRDVIELHRAGLGDELLIAVIEVDGGPFALGLADIHDLKGDGVSERVIAALVRTGARRSAPEGHGTPTVHVEQHVTSVVPGTVLLAPVLPYHATVVPAYVHGHPRTGSPTHTPPRTTAQPRAPFDHRVEIPPATWITPSRDGRVNVPSTPVRRERPPATWVTPNPGRAEAPRTPPPPAAGTERPRAKPGS
jgi:hypothetical protein